MKALRIILSLGLLFLLTAISTPALATTAEHVHLVFATWDQIDDPCHAAPTERTVPTQGFVTVIACTYDVQHQPVSTLGSEQWVRFARTGPVAWSEADTETTADGLAEATLYMTGAGTSEITVTLCPEPSCATAISSASVVLHAQEEDPPLPDCRDEVDNDNDGFIDFPDDFDCASPDDLSESVTSSQPVSNVTIRYEPERARFAGGLTTPDEPRCEPGRRVKVKKVRPGRNLVIGRDRTNRRGNWVVPRRRPHGRFYAVAMPEFRFSDSEGVDCARQRSVTIRVR
jgi:hypothetical protein